MENCLDFNVQSLQELLGGLDPITYNHSVRVMMIASELEEKLQFADHELSQAALLHDIGKFYIPSNILNKPDRLNGLEREIIDLHSYIGYKMLHSLGMDERICRIVLYHHCDHPATLQELEDFDGDSVMNKAHILRTIDVFEALTSNRPYHCGMPFNEALKVIIKDKSHHKDVICYIADVLLNEKSRESAIFGITYKKGKGYAAVPVSPRACI